MLCGVPTTFRRGSEPTSKGPRPFPLPPVKIDYEASAFWLSTGPTDSYGQIVVLQPSGEHLSLDVATSTWERIPNAPVVVVNRNLQVVV